jgi:hypothetical protein
VAAVKLYVFARQIQPAPPKIDFPFLSRRIQRRILFWTGLIFKEEVPLPEQSYSNHRQTVPMFHLVLLPVLLLTVIGSAVNLYESWGDHERLYSAALILALSFCAILTALFCRMFALKAQDRAIRVEENLRHFVLTGKLLDPRLSIRQIIALRFAGDVESPLLAEKAAAEGTAPDAIKQSIRAWRADTYRV